MSRAIKKNPLAVNNSKLNSILSSTSFAKKANRSLVDPSGSEIIQLSQEEVTFINTEVSEVYEISMVVRNVSQKSIRLTIIRPKSQNLTVTLEKDGKEGVIAPGLEKKIIVTYSCDNNRQVRDKMVLYSENQFQIEVPINVYPSANHISFDPFINLGFMKIGNNYQHRIPLHNLGVTPAEIYLKAEVKGAKVVLEPSFVTIEPKKTEQVTMHISSLSKQSVGVEGSIQISPSPVNQSIIEFSGSFCEYTKYISSANDPIQISELKLKPLFGGQKTNLCFNIVNNTPKKCQFRLIRKKGMSNENGEDQGTFLITPQQFGRDDEQKMLSFNPTEGELEPYSRKQINCNIIAKIEENDHQMFCNYAAGNIKLLPEEIKEWSYIIKAHFNDQDIAKNLLIKGSSIIPKLSVSATFIKFDDAPIRSKNIKILKVENLSDRPIPIVLEKSHNYSFIPNKFQLAKDECREVEVIFQPKIVGDMNEICFLRVSEFCFPIKVLGKGIFVNPKISKKLPTQSKVEDNETKQLEIEQASELQEGFLEGEQISMINEKSIYLENTIKNTTTHFDISSIQYKFDMKKNEEKMEKKKRSIKNRHGKQVQVDLNNFNPNEVIEEYPCPVKNSQEQRLTTRQLTLNEFKNIPVGPNVIQLGEVFIRTPIRKTFHICNLNSKAISIQLETRNHPQFEKSSKNIQLLPSESHGGLSICFTAGRDGPFRHNLQYVINGRHYFEIQVLGTAILPTIIPSKTDFRFIAGEDDNTFEKKESFTLTNSYPYEAQFSFLSQKQSLFKFLPSKGVIEPNSKIQVKIIHNFLTLPQGGGRVEESVKMRIINGSKIDLKCISVVPECLIISKPNQLNFKQISIGKSHELKFSLRNASKNFTVFKIVPNKDIQDNVDIITSKSKLCPDQVIEVTIKLHLTKQALIDSYINIIARGARKITIPVRANVIIPVIKIEGQDINFGSMPVCSSSNIKTITFINDSPISASLQLVLANDSFIQRCLTVIPQVSENISISALKENRDRKCKICTIKISKKCKVSMNLQFTPEEVKEYKFILPLYLSGSYEQLPNLQKEVVCRSLKNRLLADSKLVDFGKIIIQQSLDNHPKSRVFTLKNPQNEEISWWINQKNLQPFSLENNKGTLKSNQQIQLKVLFYNGIPGEFQRQLQFFVDKTDFQPGKPYMKMLLTASANYPEIYFDRPYVILPVVKLNTISKSQFQIINGGYENLNIKHVISPQYSHINLNVKYINGSNLGIAKKAVIVEVSFSSQKPVSFTVKIDFYDHHNRIFSILVSGTADSSLYSIEEEEWNSNFEEQLQKSSSFLINYLNGLGFLEDPMCDFPNHLTDNDYQGLHKLLLHFSNSYDKIDRNRSIVGKKATSFDITLQNYQYLAEVIKNLKSQGAFLSQIRPEFLMTENQFKEILSHQANNPRIFSHYKYPTDQLFQMQRTKSWIILVYQILKVYSKVPVKKKVNDFWSIFSSREKTIISWLQTSYQSEAMLEEAKSCDDLKTLGDGEMLSALVTKYTNIKILENYGRLTLTEKERENKCKKIIQIFQQIGIAGNIRVQDLLRSKPRQMLVFLEKLYMILPSYLQKGQPIIFSCALGQSLTKSIQIRNPSKFSVTYVAKIQDSKAYMIESEAQFTIEPKQKYEIKVKYISNIDLTKKNATLTLTGLSSSKFTPSTFIFVLKSQNLGRISEKALQVTGVLYEPHQFQVNVKNTLTSDASLTVEINSLKQNKNQEKSLLIFSPVIKMRKDQTIPVTFVFLPFSMDPHKYTILFKDPNVGQFQYQMTGIVEQPNIMPDAIRIPHIFFTNKSCTIQVSIPLKNDLLMKAKKTLESLQEKIFRKNLANSKKLNNSLHKANRKNSSLITKQEEQFLKLKQGSLSSSIYSPPRPETFQISLTPHTQMVVLKTNTLTIEPEGAEDALFTNKRVTLEVNMKVPVKDGIMHLAMKNASGTDIRKYKLIINSIYKPLRYELEMKTPVNQSITQPIPLINITTEPNEFNIIFTSQHFTSNMPDPKKVEAQNSTNSTNSLNIPSVFQFTNQRDIIVGPREQKTSDLTFNPKNQQTYNGLIRVENVTTGQLVEYEVIGIGEQPLAEIHKFQQFVNQTKHYQLKVDSKILKPHRLKVIKCTFPSENIKYEKVVNITGVENTSFFKFSFFSKFPRTYEGRIHIEDQYQIHAFQISINVEQNITGQLNIRAIERVRQFLSLPIQKGGLWKIEHNDSNIQIPSQLTLQQGQKIQFSYESAKTGQKQSYLILKNDQHGSLKYVLNITVEDQPQTIIDNIEAELGKTHTHKICIQNTDSYPITVSGSFSNEEVFYYQPEGVITIPPKTIQQVNLIYRPTCLERQSGKIHFISSNNQKWKYELIGQGLLQKKAQVIQTQAQVNKQIIETINFSNPFRKPVTIFLFLEGQNLCKPSSKDIRNEEQSEGFRLISKCSKMNLNYLEQTSIAVRFLGKQVKNYQGKLKILINQKIYWNFIINVNTICEVQEEFISIKLPTRKAKQVNLMLNLPFLPSQFNEKSVQCHIMSSSETMAGLLQNTCKINRYIETIKNEKVSLQVSFLSYKPFVCPLKFVVMKSGCQWVYRGEVNFQMPEPDDEFQMVSQMQKATSVVFRQTNRIKSHAKFKAYMASGSDMDLSLSPKAGQLEPYGREGTAFEVTFAPTQFKNSWQGKIIIETQDSFWSYIVIGKLPHYEPPVGKSLINTMAYSKTSRMKKN